MIKHALVLSALCATAACGGDESVAQYGAAGHVWRLAELDGAPFTARATMEFGAAGWIKGTAPCNRYSMQQTAPYPWFETRPAMVTKMACPDLAAETMFFKALGDMQLSEVNGDTLILSNETGRSMVFKSE